MQKPSIAIIGGGVAGLSAAVALVDRGFSVTLFEAGSQLGGRARTVVVENNNLMHLLDNGQHILLGAYRETIKLVKKMDINPAGAFLRMPLTLDVRSTSYKESLKNGSSALNIKPVFLLQSAHYLPAPLNLLVGLLGCQGLSFKEKWSAISLIRHLRRSRYKVAQDAVLESFLNTHKQSTRLITLLWEPLCLAALNTPLAEASTRVFLNVLHDSFEGKKTNSDFLLPRLDLSQILSQPMARYIQQKGATVKLSTRVLNVEAIENGFLLKTNHHDAQEFSHVIVATPANRVRGLLESLPKLSHILGYLDQYTYQPIYTVYLQYAAHITLPKPIAGLADGFSQWVFDRGQLCGQHGLIAVIISAVGKHQKITQDELALRVARELHVAYPHLEKPLWNKVIAEKRATFTCKPDLYRPTHKTAQTNLYLAGDYTYADYPATIEGAIRSGLACAALIANNT